MNTHSRNPRYKKSPSIIIGRYSEVELASIDYDRQHLNSFVGNRYDQSDKSSVEIHINKSAQNILHSRGNHQSILLDVTLIKPNDNNRISSVEKNVLRVPEVKELLLSLDKQKRDKRNVCNNYLQNDLNNDDTILRIATHKPCDKRSTSEGRPPPLLHSPKIRRQAMDYEREKQRVLSSSAPVDRHGNKRSTCLAGIRETVDPLFLNLKESLRNVEARIHAMQEDMGGPDETWVNNPRIRTQFGDYSTSQQVYRTMRGSKDMQVPLCENTYAKPEETGRPCLCHHCGMIGLVSETQKYPFVAHSPEPKELFKKHANKHDKSKHSESAGQSDLNERQLAYLQTLAERVRVLEERLEIQEEKAVPKEYFKRIITKIVSHFSEKTAKIQNELPILRAELMNSKKDYDIGSAGTDQPGFRQGYRTHHFAAFIPKRQHSGMFQKDAPHLNRSNSDSDAKKVPKTESIWRWGSEILKPGIDLKNKILSLLNVTLNKFAKRMDEAVAAQNRKDIKCGEDSPYRPPTVKRSKTYVDQRNVDNSYNMNDRMMYSIFNQANQEKCDIFKPLVIPEYVKHDYRQRSKTDSNKYTSFEKKCIKQSMIPRPSPNHRQPFIVNDNNNATNKNINVAYLNPKASTWKEESSSASMKVDYAEEEAKAQYENIKEAEKKEFMNTLSKTNDCDKERLWQSIWTQAQLNGQNRGDKVTIQIPKQRPTHDNYFNDGSPGDIVEIEFTIADLEAMLLKHR